MKVFVCITTRDGKPDYDVVQAAQAACAHFSGTAMMGFTKNAHNVCVSRNEGVAKMMSSDFTHILFVDNDVTIPIDAIERLMELDSNVATGCVPTTVSDRPFITVAQKFDPLTNAVTWQSAWFAGVRDTPICGGACLLVKREVFETLGFPWFRWPERLSGGCHAFTSEDVDFCVRVGAAGLGPIRAHGDVRCGHERRLNVASLIKDEADVWGSHRGPLVLLGKRLDPNVVVEYGCGHYSTPLFLTRVAFQSVDRVTSYDSDEKWLNELSITDERWRAIPCELSKMTHYIDPCADLVFIDCGSSRYEDGSIDYSVRADLFRAYEETGSTVVLHDAEMPQLAEAVRASTYKYKTTFNSKHGPTTAVASNTLDVTTLGGRARYEPSQKVLDQDADHHAAFECYEVL